MRVAGGGAGGGGSSYPPSGNLQIYNGGPNNAAPLALETGGAGNYGKYQGASDNTGKTLILHVLSGAPWLKAILYDHATGFSSDLTLSGFGTFTSAPTFHVLGYDIENSKYWVAFSANGGSGSITVSNLYPLTVSGSTLTLGAGITPPAIASKAVNTHGNCVYNGKIIQTYNDTVNFRIDTARVYDISGASWATPSGGTTSPYAANSSATLDSNVPDEVAFSSGGQNNKAYMSCNHANNLPVFIEFNFSTESFTDKTSAVPVRSDSASTTLFTMGMDPSGNYAVGFFRSGSNPSNGTFFIYDTLNDELILYQECILQVVSGSVIPGDESNGNLGWIVNLQSSTPFAFKIPYVKENSPTSGTLAGFQAVGTNASGDYGATNCAALVNIDGNGWQVFSGPSLWDQGGFERLMLPYSDTIEIIFVGIYSTAASPVYPLRTAPEIYYTN